MVKDGFRKNRTDDLDQKTKRELCECLWSVLIIADELGINLENDFIYTSLGISPPSVLGGFSSYQNHLYE